MKVLVATADSQGQRPNDFHAAIAGEVVMFPLVECSVGDVDDRCGCHRAMFGVTSRRATTTVKVADLPVVFDELVAMLRTAIVDGEWPLTDEQVVDVALEQADAIVEEAASWSEGVVLERREHGLQLR